VTFSLTILKHYGEKLSRDFDSHICYNFRGVFDRMLRVWEELSKTSNYSLLSQFTALRVTLLWITAHFSLANSRHEFSSGKYNLTCLLSNCLVSWNWKRLSKIQHSLANGDQRRTDCLCNCTQVVLNSPRNHTDSHWFRQTKDYISLVEICENLWECALTYNITKLSNNVIHQIPKWRSYGRVELN